MKKSFFTLLLVATLLSSLFIGCAPQPAKTSPPSASAPGSTPTPASEGAPSFVAAFADNPGYTYTGTPSVPAYTVEPGLANIVNKPQFTTGYTGGDGWDGYWLATALSDDAISMIVKNGFAVSDKANWTEYFAVYESNRYNSVPSFITTDSALHTFHLLFDYVLKDLEQQRLYGELIDLSGELVAASEAQYRALAGTDFENAARRNVAFFSVGASLLDPDFAVASYAQGLVEQELALIEAHSGIAESPLINAGETFEADIDAYQADYSQYIPRGHYTLTPELTAYFKAMMWYGQMTFRSAYEDEVKSALLQTSALQDETCQTLWMLIFEPTNFFVGECDDITWYQYQAALEDVYGQNLGDVSAVTDPAAFSKAMEKIAALAPPAINSVPIFDETLQPDKNRAITGYRFLGQRFTIDGAVMQRLMDRETAERMLPKALDIPAAFGSEEAYAILEAEGDPVAYPQYAGNLEKVRRYITSLTDQTWHSNLYWAWLDTLRPLADAPAGAGMPFFMRNQAWTRKELNTFIGSWSELKHDTLLYAKQPMAEMGDGDTDPPEPPDDRGYVEPNPEVYGRLAALVQMTLDGLEQRGLLTDPAREALGVLKTLSDGLRTISEKELANASLTGEEYEFIRVYGGELEHIFETAKKDELNQPWSYYLNEHPGAVVADVATDPNGAVLEEGTGFAKEIYVAFPRDGKVVLARGVVFSQYEFTVPLAERMTDEAWHEQLRRGEEPPDAEWKKAFLADTDYVPPYFYAQTEPNYGP
ncbi:MAG: DUF3160 domain-containing protein [Oscillospiraceae bacterium]|jgi:hypothetical protein|nr:DUF3160 domain-containing protein [Oscillospiraceae bacterium]